jgi:hypothetical protein
LKEVSLDQTPELLRNIRLGWNGLLGRTL